MPGPGKRASSLTQPLEGSGQGLPGVASGVALQPALGASSKSWSRAGRGGGRSWSGDQDRPCRAASPGRA
eukprot:1446753-Heterocapsa_arctica.AAC.1